MFKKIILITLFFIFNIYFMGFSLFAQNNITQDQWPEFKKWYEWKITTNLNKEQKQAIVYLERTSNLFERVFDTKVVQKDSKYGYSDRKKAITIAKQSLREISKMPYLAVCSSYRYYTIKAIQTIISYHRLRLKYKEETPQFEDKFRQFQLSEIKNGFEDKRFSEYFNVMKQTGLFDNIEKEMRDLHK